MQISTIDNYSPSNIATTLENALLNNGTNVLNASTTGTSSASSATGLTTDSSQLSPFAQLLSILQLLQQDNPSRYKQVTAQIAANLQNAAQTASSGGDTAHATLLTKLSKDFTSASTSGQLPNVQDLAQAVGDGYLHGRALTTSASSGSDTDADSTGSTSPLNQALEQVLAAFQSLSNQINSSQGNSLSPLSIITSTLSAAGIKVN